MKMWYRLLAARIPLAVRHHVLLRLWLRLRLMVAHLERLLAGAHEVTETAEFLYS